MKRQLSTLLYSCFLQIEQLHINKIPSKEHSLFWQLLYFLLKIHVISQFVEEIIHIFYFNFFLKKIGFKWPLQRLIYSYCFGRLRLLTPLPLWNIVLDWNCNQRSRKWSIMTTRWFTHSTLYISMCLLFSSLSSHSIPFSLPSYCPFPLSHSIFYAVIFMRLFCTFPLSGFPPKYFPPLLQFSGVF